MRVFIMYIVVVGLFRLGIRDGRNADRERGVRWVGLMGRRGYTYIGHTLQAGQNSVNINLII